MFKNIFKSLLRDTFVYGLAGSVAKFSAIITMPIVLRMLTKEQYGVFDASFTFATIFGSFIIFGQDSAIARLFYDKKDSPEYRKAVVSTGALIQILATTVMALVFFGFSNQIGKLLIGGNNAVLLNWKIALLMLPGSAMVYFCTNIFKWTFQRNNYLLISLGQTFLNVALTVYCVAVLKMGILGVILPIIISSYLFSLIGIFLNRKYLSLKKSMSDFSLFKEMLFYGFPFFLAMLLTSFLPSLDRLFLVRYASLELIGVYGVAMRVASLMTLVTGAFQIAFGPYAFSMWHRQEAPVIFERLFKVYFIVISLLSITICSFGSVILSVLATARYSEALLILPVLLMAYSIQGLLEFTLLGILWSKKTYLNILVTVATVAVLFAANFVLVPLWTIMGAAVAGLLSKIFMNIISYVISNKYYRIPIRVAPLALMVLFACVAFGAMYFDFYFHGIVSGIIKYCAPVIYCIVCFYFVLTHSERKSVMMQVKNLQNRLAFSNH